MSDTLWGIAHGKAFDARYLELFGRKTPEETRTPEEIVENIRNQIASL